MITYPVGDITSQGGSKYAGRPICCWPVSRAAFLVSTPGCPGSSGAHATSVVAVNNVANKLQTKRCQRTDDSMGNLLQRGPLQAAHGRYHCQSTPDAALTAVTIDCGAPQTRGQK